MCAQTVGRGPAPVIILDGAYSARPELDDVIDLSVSIEIPTGLRLARLAAREEPEFLAAWYERWDAAEDYYFTQPRFDITREFPRAELDLLPNEALRPTNDSRIAHASQAPLFDSFAA